jgi:hypothetical protein
MQRTVFNLPVFMASMIATVCACRSMGIEIVQWGNGLSYEKVLTPLSDANRGEFIKKNMTHLLYWSEGERFIKFLVRVVNASKGGLEALFVRAPDSKLCSQVCDDQKLG